MHLDRRLIKIIHKTLFNQYGAMEFNYGMLLLFRIWRKFSEGNDRNDGRYSSERRNQQFTNQYFAVNFSNNFTHVSGNIKQHINRGSYSNNRDFQYMNENSNWNRNSSQHCEVVKEVVLGWILVFSSMDNRDCYPRPTLFIFLVNTVNSMRISCDNLHRNLGFLVETEADTPIFKEKICKVYK